MFISSYLTINISWMSICSLLLPQQFKKACRVCSALANRLFLRWCTCVRDVSSLRDDEWLHDISSCLLSVPDDGIVECFRSKKSWRRFWPSSKNWLRNGTDTGKSCSKVSEMRLIEIKHHVISFMRFPTSHSLSASSQCWRCISLLRKR